VAGEIVHHAADELATLAMALLAFYPGRTPVPIALAGGMLEREPLRAAVTERLRSGRFVPEPDIPDPLAGALALGDIQGRESKVQGP
jgi:hypothetical protein